MNTYDTRAMDPNTAFYIVTSARRRPVHEARRVGPSYGTLEHAARALSFLRKKLPGVMRLHIEQDVRRSRDDD